MRQMFAALALSTLFAGNALADSDCTGTSEMWGLLPVLDAATDDGNGNIRVAWSLAPAPSCYTAVHETPENACVRWWLEAGTGESDQCFTAEAGSQSDLVFDSGMAADDALRDSGVGSATYRVRLAVTYGGVDILMWSQSPPGGATVEVAAPWTNAQAASL